MEKLSGLSKKEAGEEILKHVKEKMDFEITKYLKESEEKAQELVEEKARNIIVLAISRYVQDEITNNSTTCVHVMDDMKGKIICREGRNIKVLEQLLDVVLIIDDKSEMITICCFNPLSSELAKKTIEYLIEDGRIQPNNIEKFVKKSISEFNAQILKLGQKTTFELGLVNIPNELLDYIGLLKFLTSFSQNVMIIRWM